MALPLTPHPLLLRANELLTQGQDYEETLQELLRLAVPNLADRCIIEEEGKEATQETRNPSGSLRLPLKAGGQALGWLVLYLEGRNLSDEERWLAQELALRCSVVLEQVRLRQGVQRAQQAHRDFVSHATHELRTPLTPLRMQARLVQKLLNKPELSPDDLETIRKMMVISDEQVTRLNSLISHLAESSLSAS